MAELKVTKEMTVKKPAGILEITTQRINEITRRGELNLPPNYSANNALKSAWLILQETKDKKDQPVLVSCTKESIMNSLLSMVVQGLNPDKKQCYFIAYGNKLICQRSYFGTEALIKRFAGAKDIYSQVIYSGDEFEYEIVGGQKTILKHKQKLENISYDKITGAYCVITFEENTFTQIMTLDQIKQCWKMSKMYPINDKGDIKPDGTHRKFTDEMCLKTVVNRACKQFINSSDDTSLNIQNLNKIVEEDELEREANQGEIIDVEITEQPPAQLPPAPPPPPETMPEEKPAATTAGPGF